ncbi:MAG: hypothetical protein P8Y45_00120 [Exilibacterium sp.]
MFDIKRAMIKAVAAINREVLEPAGLVLTPITDDVRYVEESVHNVWKNLALGALLATACRPPSPVCAGCGRRCSPAPKSGRHSRFAFLRHP